MPWNFKQVLDIFSKKDSSRLLSEGLWGLEKESQRIDQFGNLALTDHPKAFGDKISNSYVTTDFSESQLELITPPLNSLGEVYKYLYSLHLDVENKLHNELMWPLSMPPKLPAEDLIPIAKFNNTAEGKEKQTYRNGLALRYGKKMQMICGLHYNFSFSDEMFDYLYKNLSMDEDKITFINKAYLSLTRNFLRYRWLLIYLFGASPSIDPTFNSVICNQLDSIEKCSPECFNAIKNYKHYATSLRVSRFGYSSSSQKEHAIHFNSIDEYSSKIRELLATKSDEYEKLGLYKDGIQTQLNYNILQKESEFYSPIRLKQITKHNETQLEALESRGIKYIEIRILDIKPFENIGVSLDQLYFLHVFMLFCLFEESNYISEDEDKLINNNHNLVALFGRKQDICLHNYSGDCIALKDWAFEVFTKLKSIAGLMDGKANYIDYQSIVENEYKKILDVSLTPSAKISNETQKTDDPFLKFGVKRALANKELN